MKKVVFIAKVSNPSKEISSVDIMTNNVILGLSQNDIDLTLMLVCDGNSDRQRLAEYYGEFAERIVFVPSFFAGKHNKYRYLFRLIRCLLSDRRYRKIIKEKVAEIGHPDVIIANKVSSDELFYGWALKKKFSDAALYQYWTDPFTLNGIDIESYKRNRSRHIFKPIEMRILEKTDRAIYGTEILMEVQKEFFPKYAHKMFYVDVAFVPCSADSGIQKEPNTLIYAGNFYSTTRNILPLLEAVDAQDRYTVDVYGNGDVEVKTTERVRYKKRISYDELQAFQGKYECRVCILNSSTFQIPGKIFYDIMCDANILVIADGKYASKIIECLGRYNRYFICNNTKEEILAALENMVDAAVDYEYIESNYSPRKISRDILEGGM